MARISALVRLGCGFARKGRGWRSAFGAAEESMVTVSASTGCMSTMSVGLICEVRVCSTRAAEPMIQPEQFTMSEDEGKVPTRKEWWLRRSSAQAM